MTTLLAITFVVLVLFLLFYYVTLESMSVRLHKPPSIKKLRRLYKMAEKKHLSLEIDAFAVTTSTVKIGEVSVPSDTWIAACTLGGMTFRGPRAENVTLAIQALLMTLANPQVSRGNDPDPVVGISLALEGTTLEQVVTGQNNRPSIGASPPGAPRKVIRERKS